MPKTNQIHVSGMCEKDIKFLISRTVRKIEYNIVFRAMSESYKQICFLGFVCTYIYQNMRILAPRVSWQNECEK